MTTDRAVSPVIATVLLVALVVILAATVGFQLIGLVEQAKDTNERPVPVSGNLLANGDFERGPVGAWQVYDGGWVSLAGQSLITQTDPYSGSLALETDGSPSFINQSLTDRVEPGKLYRLCAQSKISTPGASFYVGVQYYDADKNIVEKAEYEIEWTTYQRQCVLTDLDSEKAVVSADVYVYGTGGGTAYVDEVSLKEVRYLADSDRDDDDR